MIISKTQINPFKFAIIGLALISYLLFQILYSTTAYVSYQHQNALLAEKVSKRVALDLPLLQIANQSMKQVANKQAITDYQNNINQQLANKDLPLRLVQIQGVPSRESDNFIGVTDTVLLTTPYQQVEVELERKPFHLVSSLSLLPLLGSLFILAFAFPALKRWRNNHKEALPEQKEEPKLIVNLNNRTLTNSVDGKSVQMSNKPFCFYVALLDYCCKSDDATLNHNKNLPPELLELASRNFYRLIELGHTIRKRPDFSANLDKMLSEIRAALDEIYKDTPELKAPYYPPKAQGEGSRSKLHNYALEGVDAENLEFIGK